jgi:hypothetical protein
MTKNHHITLRHSKHREAAIDKLKETWELKDSTAVIDALLAASGAAAAFRALEEHQSELYKKEPALLDSALGSYANIILGQRAVAESLTPEALITTAAPGSAALRISSAVDELIEKNVAADEGARRPITASLIRRMSGSNLNTIKRWMSAHDALISKHHKKYGISLSDSRSRLPRK